MRADGRCRTRNTKASAGHRFAAFLIATLLAAPHALAEQATFAGGCFWCMEEAFEKVPGVTDVVSGFTGGTLQNPTYRGDHRGHFEAVLVTFDAARVSYRELLDVYWRNVDPFDNDGQFCDKGFEYRAAIFVDGDEEARLAQESLDRVAAMFPGQTVVTTIRETSRFWPVEAYHQDYSTKNPIRYRLYKTGCGRASRLERIWGAKD